MSKRGTVQTFAERVRDARSDKGYSQTDLAKACGMVPSAINHYEAARHTPTLDSLCKIAIALGVTTDWLLGIDG